MSLRDRIPSFALPALPESWSRPPRGGLLLPLGLGLLVLVSALLVVRVEHGNRVLNERLDALRKERDLLQVEWAQLRLEEATLARNTAIERVAREELGMSEPRDYVVIEDRP